MSSAARRAGTLVKGVYGAVTGWASDPATQETPVQPAPASLRPSPADAWWDSLSPARKAAVHRWLADRDVEPAEHPGQVSLLDLVESPS